MGARRKAFSVNGGQSPVNRAGFGERQAGKTGRKKARRVAGAGW